MDLKWNKEEEVNPATVLSTEHPASGSCGVSIPGSVKNDFNKHEQSVSVSVSQWEVDYISFLSSLWFDSTGDNTAHGIILMTDILSKFWLQRSLQSGMCFAEVEELLNHHIISSFWNVP